MYPIGFGPMASEVSPVATTSRVHDTIFQVPRRAVASTIGRLRRTETRQWRVGVLGTLPPRPGVCALAAGATSLRAGGCRGAPSPSHRFSLPVELKSGQTRTPEPIQDPQCERA